MACQSMQLHVGLHEILAGNVITCLEPQVICQCRLHPFTLQLQTNVKAMQELNENAHLSGNDTSAQAKLTC